MEGEEETRKRVVVESLGWITESSIMPKKHRAIEGVGPSSIMELKAQLYKSQEEAKQTKDLTGSDDYHRRRGSLSKIPFRIMCFSWKITSFECLELDDCTFFGLTEALGFAPSWHLWLRYSSFLLLYPTGITSLVGLIYLALPHIKTSKMYIIRMPNTLNFSIDYFYATIIVLATQLTFLRSYALNLFGSDPRLILSFIVWNWGLRCCR